MWGLEYVLLFGLAGNTWGLLEGRVGWALAFLARDVARAHVAA
jgi:hypothetical protein